MASNGVQWHLRKAVAGTSPSHADQLRRPPPQKKTAPNSNDLIKTQSKEKLNTQKNTTRKKDPDPKRESARASTTKKENKSELFSCCLLGIFANGEGILFVSTVALGHLLAAV